MIMPPLQKPYLVRKNPDKAQIGTEIQALPKKMKLVFEMSLNINLSHEEIAEQHYKVPFLLPFLNT